MAAQEAEMRKLTDGKARWYAMLNFQACPDCERICNVSTQGLMINGARCVRCFYWHLAIQFAMVGTAIIEYMI